MTIALIWMNSTITLLPGAEIIEQIVASIDGFGGSMPEMRWLAFGILPGRN